MEREKIELDPQWLDNHYEHWYFVPWPDSQYFDDMEDDYNVIPVNTQTMVGSFVYAEWASNGCKEEEEYEN